MFFNYYFFLTGKANRLKQAKKEADTEINQYKADRERQYKDYEAKVYTVFNNIACVTITLLLTVGLSLLNANH